MAVILIHYVCFLILLVCQGIHNEDNILSANTIPHPASDFSRFTLVKPKICHGREKRQISSTKQENGEHVDYLEITLEIDGENLILDLTLNKQLIPKGFFHRYQTNGKNVVHKPAKEEIDHCHYNGKVRGKPDSWVAISTCDGLSGVVFDGKEMHYVEKDNRVDQGFDALQSDHFVYRHSDVVEQNKTCGYAGDARNPEKQHTTTDNRFHRYKRSTESHDLIRGPYNANKESKYVELVLVVDNREYKELGESRSRVINHCKSIANIINGLYSPLNIFIALVGVVIWTEHDEMIFSPDGDSTLTSFLHYRKQKLLPDHPNDNAQLLTKFNFDHGVVGKALKGPMCTYEYSGGVNTDHSPVVGLVATTIAHEMGHNFGMEHDTTVCKCPEERCIMAPSSSTVAPTHWSSCSLNYLLLAFTHGMDYCLKNKPESLFDSPVCGNGFVEQGEQCDCGLPEHCDNPCCNASTCMLYNNASCATGECCDLTTCKPKNAGTLCRSADYECDLPEYCTGQSEYCPDDIYKLDTEECDGGHAFCYHGFCRTRTDQCQLLWGETGTSSDDQCYDMNIKGNRHGNCGFNKFNQSFFKCESESVLCGMLHCKHLNERLEFGMESVAILSHSFINKKGSIVPCRTAIVDLGTNQIDPGLTPDGARCGDGKMCVNQRCRDVLSLRKLSPSCENDCHGNGWCNNKGHCHCKDGFAPPFCEYPGPGGSEDSGPASDPNAHQGVVVAMFIIFLGVIPTLAILAFLSYYAKYNMKFSWKKSPPVTSKSPSKSRGAPQTAKRTEDNHSLLHEDSLPQAGLNNEFFGNFKGFSLTPMKKQEIAEPVRPAPSAAAQIGSADQNHSTIPNYQKPPPPVPKAVGKVKNTLFTVPVQKMNSFKKNTLLNGIKSTNSSSTVPALPPPNPGSTARPIISSPVLSSSTSNAKELISPLRNAPKMPIRPAPEAPLPETKITPNTSNILSTPNALEVHTVLDVNIDLTKRVPKEKEKETGISTLNRIASFLKPGDKKQASQFNTLTKSNQVKAQKILDKETLRNLEISNPVPQTEIDIGITVMPVDAAAKKAVVMRAQSMRATKPKDRPNIQTFGSMRQPGYKRPLSIPSGARPKSPPPPRPPDSTNSSSERLKENQNQYDDCLNEAAPLARLSETDSPSGDNIYAVIEETPSPEKVTSGAGSTESMGLLSEIVCEIQNRNIESIYSTSTLNRKKMEAAKKANENLSPTSSEYANTVYKPENEYSNMGNIKSSASSTSSGYILPSAVNVPLKEPSVPSVHNKPPIRESQPVLSSFKADASTKPFSSTFKRPPGPLATANTSKRLSDSYSDKTTDNKVGSSDSKSAKSKTVLSPTTKTPPSPVSKSPSKINRQVTPPNLKGRKPSPTRPISQASVKSNRSVTNSPDLVTSCNSNSSSKGPDVLNGGSLTKKPSIVTSKPIITSQKPTVKISNNQKSVSFKNSFEKKNEVKPPVAAKVMKAASDVGASKTASVGVKQAAKSNSTVSSLQQKFEEKNTAKPAGKIK
ncbi:disintegrin and metalloproteinase domain-containing protein 12 [Sitophilus oryzae]|uniref:Disintegrin and metalloproteinase domain-containing protein 12 n=1 Tax=Sitophilus oryzae TaxID=7048 RepID=A0A6J2XTG7_SITOR|nr:disintegrin and metalloproteinase domain-containing protein 12 [Sitophilus oryzae]